jgi:hypothetical protein
MQARFPLSFTGSMDPFVLDYPEITEIAIKVNGASVNTQRLMQPSLPTHEFYGREEIPWAVFDVTFPPAQDVTIEVRYTAEGFGYYPHQAFRYILETGAGWKDTIGSGDIIVHLPYEVNERNVWPAGDTGYSETSPGAVLSGNEVRWHFENLEPTEENNISITVVTPALWQKVLIESENVRRDPKDGEAWGRLAKAYKEVIKMPKGFLRDDAVGHEVYELSKQAYEKCLTLLPRDAQWHYGYADLLWAHYYSENYWTELPDSEGLYQRILTELKTALELDPNNQPARELLDWIESNVPGSVEINGSDYDFLGLTATPIPPTPWFEETETPVSTPTINSPSPTSPPIVPSPVPTDQTGPLPACGGAAMVLPALFGILWLSKRKIR